MTNKITPMRRQYLEIKRQYPDTILLFRLGDFYETFDDDAKIVASVCDITLTTRPVGKGQRVPLAGVPYHSVEGYLAKLIKAGHKVAICEQQGNKAVNGLVPRRVRQIITPGTILSPTLLPDRRNNYIVALALAGERIGISYADISTGEFATTQIEGEDAERRLREEINRLAPAELLLPGENTVGDPPLPPALAGIDVTVSTFPAWHFEEDNARNSLLRHFGVSSLGGFGCEGKVPAIRAAGGLLAYLEETQKQALQQLDNLITYALSDFMNIDEATWRNLELTETLRGGEKQGSLLSVLDMTKTSMGGRLLRRWLGQPLLHVEPLQARLDAVALLVEYGAQRDALREALRGLGDLERWTNRLINQSVTPRDLVGIREALSRLPAIRQRLFAWLESMTLPADHPLRSLAGRLDACAEEYDLLQRAIAPDPPATLGHPGVIAAGYAADLDRFHREMRQAKAWIANLEQQERQRTGIKSLKVGFNQVFGYYLEITKANSHLVPDDYIRKQTLVNAERYITPALKEYEAKILTAQEAVLALERDLFRDLVETLARRGRRLLETARAVAELDVYASLAEVAARYNYVRPELGNDDAIEIVAGRHPVVELLLKDEPFVPNDTSLHREGAIHIITGPNMSGKSTYLRQVALIVLLAQIGSFVPAQSAHIGLVDRIFTRIGASDEIHRGRSTFMVEMVEAANILRHASSRSLVILDELGRGTSTYDGLALAWAIIEYIHNNPRLGCKTLFATHYHELVEMEHLLPRVRNDNVAVAETGGGVVFLHKIVPGGADKSYGIHVARLAGLPASVVHRAQEIMTRLEEQGPRDPTLPAEVAQMPLFIEENPAVEALLALNLEELTPIGALNKLYELQRLAQESRSSG